VPFVAVARLADLPERRGTRVRVGDEDVALWRVEGKVYAIGNVCPHQHAAVLYQATLSGLEVTCPMHGWTYSLETGKVCEGSGRVRTYKVEVIGEAVMVDVTGSRE
jgi:NAD(P)H-dependent nitrite reductase small subunit